MEYVAEKQNVQLQNTGASTSRTTDLLSTRHTMDIYINHDVDHLTVH